MYVHTIDLLIGRGLKMIGNCRQPVPVASQSETQMEMEMEFEMELAVGRWKMVSAR